ncbi:MAG: formylglycine-generating enzyme family protein [Burkholderiales bacterium]
MAEPKGPSRLVIGLALGVAACAALVAAWIWLARPAAVGVRAERANCPLPGEAPDARHAGMVWVPGGSFDIGDTVYAEEGPLTRTTVAGFWIDRTEVTNAQFAAFVAATGYVTVAERAVDRDRHAHLPPQMQKPGAVVFTMPTDLRDGGDLRQWWRYVPGANWRHPGGPGSGLAGRAAHPVVSVALEDAQAYARWKGRSLPTEAQWEWAARGARADALPARDQPREANTWQGLFPVINDASDGFAGSAPVGCYAPNALGLYDMIGNVWELTADAWTENHAALPNDPSQGLQPMRRDTGSGARVIKGGSFLCAPNYCMRYRAAARQAQEDDLAASHVGFRTVLVAPGP